MDPPYWQSGLLLRSTSVPDIGSTSPELLVELDRSRPRGLRAQVEEGVRSAIRSGRLPAGTRLPSSRALAADLQVTRGVVVEAYDQLAAEGYVTSTAGSGTRVNDVTPARGNGGVPATGPGRAALRVDFRTGLPDLGLFPRAALAVMPDAELGYAGPAGLPRLRAALAGYLGRVRGVACTPGQVVVCN